MTRSGDTPCRVGATFRANVFWLGKLPLRIGHKYKLKIGSHRSDVVLSEILSVIDSSNLSRAKSRAEVVRNEVAECVFQTLKPFAFDLASDFENTGRFVLIDQYEISGGGIIQENLTNRDWVDHAVSKRELAWVRSDITPQNRAERFVQNALVVAISGFDSETLVSIGKLLEQQLFKQGRNVYFLGMGNVMSGLDQDVTESDRMEHVRRLGEIAHLFADAGVVFLTSIEEMDNADANLIRTLVAPTPLRIVTGSSVEGSSVNADFWVTQSGLDAMVNEISAFLSKQTSTEYSI